MGETLGEAGARDGFAFFCLCANGARVLRAFIVSQALSSCWRNSLQVSLHCRMACACAFMARWCGVSLSLHTWVF